MVTQTLQIFYICSGFVSIYIALKKDGIRIRFPTFWILGPAGISNHTLKGIVARLFHKKKPQGAMISIFLQFRFFLQICKNICKFQKIINP